MNPALSADILLALHALIPTFILGGIVAIPLGAAFRWKWIRNKTFRAVHAGLMGIVLLQAMLGRLCPLTLWEHEMRVRAGQNTAEAPPSFMQYWVGRLLYHDLPMWVFVVAYLVAGLLIALLWIAVPPTSSRSTRWRLSRD